MALEARSTEDLMSIASVGGGFRLKAGARSTEDLMRIALCASENGARLYLGGLASRSTEDLMRIASVGEGAVVFED